MVAIDTDVLTLAFAFHRDPRQEANARFLAVAREADPIVTIYSVMELLGQLSFNLAPELLVQWPAWLQDAHGLVVAYPATNGANGEDVFRQEIIRRPLAKMQQHPMPFLDTLIINLVERIERVDSFVTWNVRHFRGKTPLPVLTPAEFIATLPPD